MLRYFSSFCSKKQRACIYARERATAKRRVGDEQVLRLSQLTRANLRELFNFFFVRKCYIMEAYARESIFRRERSRSGDAPLAESKRRKDCCCTQCT